MKLHHLTNSKFEGSTASRRSVPFIINAKSPQHNDMSSLTQIIPDDRTFT